VQDTYFHSSDIPISASQPLLQQDPLAFLPCTRTTEYQSGYIIYSQAQPATRLFLLVEGKVKVARQSSGLEVIVDVYKSDEFFGEAALTGAGRREEIAIALERTRVMSWTSQEIEESACARPKLAIAMLQLMVRRADDFESRIESFSCDSITQRLMRTLIRFADRFGHKADDGSIKMNALTHEFLSQYIGTTREIVTHRMSQFRRDGYLEYSRSDISLHPRVYTDWFQSPSDEFHADRETQSDKTQSERFALSHS
jgi:CRP/FNR family transcriptional regulator, cyclic AMP receptor protein